ncbi:hypothetical protein [Streptomyces vinaceus]|uniref:hypothetical protein n=1 Tax=Streptomyces vinaceus TaxID=1960 RepID=UPI0036A17C0A
MSHRPITPSQCQSCTKIARYLREHGDADMPSKAVIGAAVDLHPKVVQRHLAYLVSCGVLDVNRRTLLIPPPRRPALSGSRAWAASVDDLSPTTARVLAVPAWMGWTDQLGQAEWAAAADVSERTLRRHRAILISRGLIGFRQRHITVGRSGHRRRTADQYTLLSGVQAEPLTGAALESVDQLAHEVLARVRWFDYAKTTVAGRQASASALAGYLRAGWPAHVLVDVLDAHIDRYTYAPRAYLRAVLASEPRLTGPYVIPAEVWFEGRARTSQCMLCRSHAWEIPGRTPLCGGDHCAETQAPPRPAPVLTILPGGRFAPPVITPATLGQTA